MRSCLVSTLLATMLHPPIARGEEIASAVTRLDDSVCRLVNRDEESEDETYECAGPQGLRVIKLNGHDSYIVSFGPNAERECVWNQGFSSYSAPEDEIEWRMKDGKIFAAIQRWGVSPYYASEGRTEIRHFMVVTQIRVGATCRIGYVRTDQRSPEETARRLADQYSDTGFDCTTMKPEVFPPSAAEENFERTGLACP